MLEHQSLQRLGINRVLQAPPGDEVAFLCVVEKHLDGDNVLHYERSLGSSPRPAISCRCGGRTNFLTHSSEAPNTTKFSRACQRWTWFGPCGRSGAGWPKSSSGSSSSQKQTGQMSYA